jgi:hypothetical protein
VELLELELDEELLDDEELELDEELLLEDDELELDEELEDELEEELLDDDELLEAAPIFFHNAGTLGGSQPGREVCAWIHW